MPIDTILFDADGVIQRPRAGRRAAWQSLLGDGGDVDAFVTALFAAERPAVEGRSDFIGSLPELLTRWRCCGTLADALAAWTMIEPDEEALQTIRDLRARGLRCHLATNQEPHRANFMSTMLGYASVFDREFYSCHMRTAKPDEEYFRMIIRALEIDPDRVLFLDDMPHNVASARRAGLHATEFVLGSRSLQTVLAEFAIALG
jgi:putative hydrolase of the HAD superfamily